jgi:hypothetical protein
MSTIRQIEANRRNAMKSTGPTSVTGKTTSSMNALKSGLHAKSLVLPSENRADLEDLIEAYYAYHRPASPIACAYVDDLIRCEWTLRRLDLAETQMWRFQGEDKYCDPEKFPLGKAATYNANSLSKLQYRLDATRRARDRALQSLQQLKADPAPVVEPAGPPSLPASSQTTSPQIGFVPSTPSTAPPQPAPAPPELRPRPAGSSSFPLQPARPCFLPRTMILLSPLHPSEESTS